jgi:hypothetical protein
LECWSYIYSKLNSVCPVNFGAAGFGGTLAVLGGAVSGFSIGWGWGAVTWASMCKPFYKALVIALARVALAMCLEMGLGFFVLFLISILSRF